MGDWVEAQGLRWQHHESEDLTPGRNGQHGTKAALHASTPFGGHCLAAVEPLYGGASPDTAPLNYGTAKRSCVKKLGIGLNSFRPERKCCFWASLPAILWVVRSEKH